MNENLNGTHFLAPGPDLDKAVEFLNGGSFLVTGGTGTFGSAFIQRVISMAEPRRLVVFSRDEAKQYEMAQRFNPRDYPFIRFFIGDVRDVERLTLAMRDIDYVIHAAALKHLPTAEYNPFECINTNVIGSENVVRAAIRVGVKRVLCLSTDKAASPFNLYGASKLAAEKIFVAANTLAGKGGARFSVVRYGNVSGSRGSVVPLFQRLVREGAESLPITDPRMTRFWMTVDEAVDFVCARLIDMQGTEIFVPRIPSIKIVDLAKAIGSNLPLETVGIRPGEKIHETLITIDEGGTASELKDHYILESQFESIDRIPAVQSGAEPVEAGFHYASDENNWFLDVDEIRALPGIVD